MSDLGLFLLTAVIGLYERVDGLERDKQRMANSIKGVILVGKKGADDARRLRARRAHSLIVDLAEATGGAWDMATARHVRRILTDMAPAPAGHAQTVQKLLDHYSDKPPVFDSIWRIMRDHRAAREALTDMNDLLSRQ
jgi:hypothetical protein